MQIYNQLEVEPEECNNRGLMRCSYRHVVGLGLHVVGDLLHVDGDLLVDAAAQLVPEPLLRHVAECALQSLCQGGLSVKVTEST